MGSLNATKIRPRVPSCSGSSAVAPLATVLLAAWPTATIAAAPLDAPRSVLGPKQAISTKGVVGSLSVISSNAAILALGEGDGRTLLPIAATTEWERGRIVALARDDFLEPSGSSPSVGALLSKAAHGALARNRTQSPRHNAVPNCEALKVAGVETTLQQSKLPATAARLHQRGEPDTDGRLSGKAPEARVAHIPRSEFRVPRCQFRVPPPPALTRFRRAP